MSKWSSAKTTGYRVIISPRSYMLMSLHTIQIAPCDLNNHKLPTYVLRLSWLSQMPGCWKGKFCPTQISTSRKRAVYIITTCLWRDFTSHSSSKPGDVGTREGCEEKLWTPSRSYTFWGSLYTMNDKNDTDGKKVLPMVGTEKCLSI